MADRVATRLTLSYDREGDILYLDSVEPYAEQHSDEVSEAVIIRSNPRNGLVESIEIQGFAHRFTKLGDTFELPVRAAMERIEGEACD